jgi:hypothetical protein
MDFAQLFHSKSGLGWLVFSGGNELTGAIRSIVIERSSLDGPLVCLAVAGDDAADRALDDMQDLGAVSGYVVDVVTEDDETIEQQIAQASIVLLPSELSDSIAVLHENLMGAPLRGLLRAYERGAILLFEGRLAQLFGGYALDDDTSQVVEGLGWLENSLVLPGALDLQTHEVASQFLKDNRNGVVIGIPVAGALAVFGQGGVETWRDEKVTVVLGANYSDVGQMNMDSEGES